MISALLTTQKILLRACCTAALLWSAASSVPPDYPDGSPSYALILKETGHRAALLSFNPDTPVPPASLTKIMTALLAIESDKLYDPVTITYEATRVEPTKAGLRVGESYRLIDLIQAALIESDNDAAYAAGLYLGGTIENFALMMNQRAAQLGMSRTHFTNPCGFDWGENLSTAADLVRLTEEAIRHPLFNQIVLSPSGYIQELTTGRTLRLSTHNHLLLQYPYSVGIKTGYTSKAGPCLIARAKREGRDLLLVMLHSRADRKEAGRILFDRGFAELGLTPEFADEEIVLRKPVPAYKVSRGKKSRFHKGSARGKKGKKSRIGAKKGKQGKKAKTKKRRR